MRLFHLAMLAALLLSACSNPSDDGNAPATAAAAPASAGDGAAPAATDGLSRIWFEPAGLRECDKPQIVTVHWDASKAPGVNRVEVKVVKANGKEVVSAYTGVTGFKQTGPWMSAGSEMVLRNRADGSELARAKVESLPCN